MDSSDSFKTILDQLKRKSLLQKIEQYNTRNWMRIHGKFSDQSRKQRQNLHTLFKDLDTENTGVVSIEELYEPLLSLGIVQNKQEVEQLVHFANANRSGVLKFEEFVKIFEQNSRGSGRNHGKVDLIVDRVAGNMKNFKKNDLPFSISVCNRRRALMMQAYVSENLVERDKGMKVINAFSAEMKSQKPPSKIDRISDRRRSEFVEGKGERLTRTLMNKSVDENDCFLNYLPPANLKKRHFGKNSRKKIIDFLRNDT